MADYAVDMRHITKKFPLVSADLEEILSLSDRIAVIYEGQIAGILEPSEATEARIGMMMTGGEMGS